jgi:poly(A) polymerase
LLYRYATSSDGGLKLRAKIYTSEEHQIPQGDIDADAVRVARTLTKAGFKAYIVGGAVRDLLLKKHPKDFDIATDARPNQVRKLFSHSRVIGRRFRLVHVFYGRNKIIEVSTFRSKGGSAPTNNIYGSLGEDATRRDFSMNALFYCPFKKQIIDYVEGLRDIRRKTVRSLIPPRDSFREDPVRMIRAVKYAAMLDLRLPHAIRSAIRKLRFSVEECSKERLTEELYKILHSGHSESILTHSDRLGLLEVLIPAERARRGRKKMRPGDPLLLRLKELDKGVRAGESISRGETLSRLFGDLAHRNPHWKDEPLTAVSAEIRDLVYPLCPSNKDLRVLSRILKHAAQDSRK